VKSTLLHQVDALPRSPQQSVPSRCSACRLFRGLSRDSRHVWLWVIRESEGIFYYIRLCFVALFFVAPVFGLLYNMDCVQYIGTGREYNVEMDV